MGMIRVKIRWEKKLTFFEFFGPVTVVTDFHILIYVHNKLFR